MLQKCEKCIKIEKNTGGLGVKKRLFIAAISVIMLLNGCGAAQKKENKEAVKETTKVETAVLKEENTEVKEEKIEPKEEVKVEEKKVNITAFAAEKITEDGAKIVFTTETDEIGYVNGLQIDVEPKKQHFYYLTGLEKGKEQSITIKAGNSEQKIVFTTKAEGINYKKPAEFAKNAVFYEIFVRSFADGNGDKRGDFKGITANLDYLKNLGIDGIWLMPINASPSYHGYDVVDYYSLNPSYGTIEDFKELLNEAHKRGIKIIMDLVLNHTGSYHPYFEKAKKGEGSPYRDWYVWSDEGGSNWYENDDGKYFFSAFWSGMPDLNYKNPLVISEAKNIADFWLDVGVDGFRLDAAYHLDDDKEYGRKFWEEWEKSVKNKKSDAYLVAENWTEAVNAAPFYSGFDSSFNFELADTIVNTIQKGSDMGLVDALKMNYAMFAKYNPDFLDAPFIRNHDMKRAMSEFVTINNPAFVEKGFKKMKQASVMLMTMGGVPYIYYGEEIGQSGKKPDENIREPFDWYKAMNGQYMTREMPKQYIKANDGVSVEEQNGVEGSMLEHYRKIIKLRKENPAMRSYEVEKLDVDGNNLYGYIKISGNEKIAAIFNFSAEDISFDSKSVFGNAKITDIYSGKDGEKNIKVEANGFRLIKY